MASSVDCSYYWVVARGIWSVISAGGHYQTCWEMVFCYDNPNWINSWSNPFKNRMGHGSRILLPMGCKSWNWIQQIWLCLEMVRWNRNWKQPWRMCNIMEKMTEIVTVNPRRRNKRTYASIVKGPILERKYNLVWKERERERAHGAEEIVGVGIGPYRKSKLNKGDVLSSQTSRRHISTPPRAPSRFIGSNLHSYFNYNTKKILYLLQLTGSSHLWLWHTALLNLKKEKYNFKTFLKFRD